MSSENVESKGGSQTPGTEAHGLGRLISLCNNPLSAMGLFAVGFALLLLISFMLFTLIMGGHNPYVDIFGYMIVPGILVFGLFIVPVGAVWKWRWLRKHRGEHVPRYVQIDLHDKATRGAITIFTLVTFFLIIPALGISGYQGYIYTESTAFCTQVCHTVMEPQGTAHASSAHARVRCAACHIGEGAGWFVKSKISGTRQVLAVWRDSFSRPIPPAIEELRPARETCEECHWPARFFGSQLREVVHFSPDERNSRRVVRMLLKTGGADESIGRVEGIHMHMLVSGQIEYVATDPHLQEIPWVRYVRADGTETVYRADGLPHDAPPPAGTRRTIDCMDCHNRGAHHFLPPQRAVELQMQAGRIDPELPYIKREAVAALMGAYANNAEAVAGIERLLIEFYQKEYPAVWKAREDVVRRAVQTVQDVYRRHSFPEMKVSWRTYPENIGHMYSPGCFRCHDGLHVDATGQNISSDCTVCHTFLEQDPEKPDTFREGMFEHSMSLLFHENLRCNQCHTGGPLPLCRDCHNEMQGLQEWKDIGRLRRREP